MKNRSSWALSPPQCQGLSQGCWNEEQAAILPPALPWPGLACCCCQVSPLPGVLGGAGWVSQAKAPLTGLIPTTRHTGLAAPAPSCVLLLAVSVRGRRWPGEPTAPRSDTERDKGELVGSGS